MQTVKPHRLKSAIVVKINTKAQSGAGFTTKSGGFLIADFHSYFFESISTADDGDSSSKPTFKRKRPNRSVCYYYWQMKKDFFKH